MSTKRFVACDPYAVLAELDRHFGTEFYEEALKFSCEVEDLCCEILGVSCDDDFNAVEKLTNELVLPELEEFARQCLAYVAERLTFRGL